MTVSVVKGTPYLALSSRAEARRIPWEATHSNNWISRSSRGFFNRSRGGIRDIAPFESPKWAVPSGP